MSALVSWLLDLGHLRPGQPGVEFEFAHALPIWAWALISLAACVLAWRSYTRLEGTRWARFTMGLLRALVLVVVALLIAGPRLIKPNEIEERDWVLVLVDRSASMTISDAPGLAAPSVASGQTDPALGSTAPNSSDGGGAAPRISREAQLRRALAGAAPALKELAKERVVVWFGFDASAYELRMNPSPPPPGTPPTTTPAPEQRAGASADPLAELGVDLGRPTGTRTDLDRALDGALGRAAARPISGVVVLSDGRSLAEPSRAVLRRLEAERIPVFSVALGDARGVSDVAIRRAESPRVAFANDSVPVEVEIERSSPRTGGGRPLEAASEVELVDMASGEVVDRQRVEWRGDSAVPLVEGDGTKPNISGTDRADDGLVDERQTARLVWKPKHAGSGRLSVRVKPAGAQADAPPDLVDSNNSAELGVELVDRPVRVLYVDGYPRWEYRYLKNLLVREPSLSSAVLLLSPRRKYLQEGTVVLDALPRSPEEWAAFDVVILGDVWPGVFTSDQLMQLRERVATSGTGLIWIAGEGSTPGAWASTALADVLPVRVNAASSGDESSRRLPAFDGPVMMRSTPAADRIGVLQLADEVRGASRWPSVLTDPSAAWAQLQWAQRIEPGLVKPTAEVLAEAVEIGDTGDGKSKGAGVRARTPLVLSMRYGAGRVIYVATDEVWRWRFARGEPLTERFYIQLLRLLGRESLSRSGKPAILEVQPERAAVQTPVRVKVTLLEQSLVDAAPASIRVKIAPAGTPNGAAGENNTEDESTELTLTPVRGGPGRGGAIRTGAADGRGAGVTASDLSLEYAATWVPARTGTYSVKTSDPLLASRSAELTARAEVWQQDDEMRRPQADHGLLQRLAEASGGRVLTEAELPRLASFLPNRRVRTSGEPEIDPLWDTPAALLAVVLLLTLEWIGRRWLRLA